ncbi:MAG: zinc ribbon domain-containing protein [Gemmataceae bacterium]
MPLYEYVCQECQHPFEALVSRDEEAACPQCQGHQLARQLSLPARPKTEAALPTACRSSGPPCGSMCSRFGQG